MEGRVDFGMSSRKLEGEELDSLEYTNICLDGIALVVNKACSVTNVTTEEVKALYEDGTPIQNTIEYALSREDGSGTRSGFEEVVGIEDLCQNEGFTQHGSTGEVRQLIADNDNCDTIGYISLGSVDSTVKAVQYNGVDANEANILNGTPTCGAASPIPLLRYMVSIIFSPRSNSSSSTFRTTFALLFKMESPSIRTGRVFFSLANMKTPQLADCYKERAHAMRIAHSLPPSSSIVSQIPAPIVTPVTAIRSGCFK